MHHVNLEKGLEELATITDGKQTIVDMLDHDEDTGFVSLGNKFYNWKEKCNDVRTRLENYFTRIMTSIKTNFKELSIPSDDKEDITYYVWMGKWQCKRCTVVNRNGVDERCNVCDAPKDYVNTSKNKK